MAERNAEIENQVKRTKAIERGQQNAIGIDRLNNVASTIKRDIVMLQQQCAAAMKELSEAYSPVTQKQKWKEHRI
jgi:hypothetical protein